MYVTQSWQETLKFGTAGAGIVLIVMILYNAVLAPYRMHWDTVHALQRQAAVHYVERLIPSTSEENPYGSYVILQAGQEIANQTMIVVFDGEVGFANVIMEPGLTRAEYRGQAVFGGTERTDTVAVYADRFLPEHPIKIAVYAPSEIEVLEVLVR